MITELERVFLIQDLKGSPFVKGDVGTVVFVYPGAQAYEVEFFALDDSTLGVETVPAEILRFAKGVKKVLRIDAAA